MSDIRVVIVDDDFAVAQVNRAFVDAQPGFTVVAEAHTGEAALAAIGRHRPQLVLLDVYLPDLGGLDVLRRSNGAAVSVGDDELRRWVLTLAAKEGLWPEASSAAPFAAIERLRAQGTIKSHERCVALMTAAGIKDPGPIEQALPEPPIVQGGLPELLDALKNSYGFTNG